jgi:hypothetical protein
MTPVQRLVMIASGLELIALVVAYALGGTYAAFAALAGASLATGAQVVAVILLRPAMVSPRQSVFQQAWVLGMAVRFASFLALAAIMILSRGTLPPVWMAAGYLGTLLVLLFAETRFLK